MLHGLRIVDNRREGLSIHTECIPDENRFGRALKLHCRRSYFIRKHGVSEQVYNRRNNAARASEQFAFGDIVV